MWGGEVFISNFQGFGKGSDDAKGHTEQGLAPQTSQNIRLLYRLEYKASWNHGLQSCLVS